MVAHSTGVDDPCLWYRINTTPIAVHLQHRRMLLISSRGPGAGILCWLKRGSAVPRGAVIRLNYAFASLWICPYLSPIHCFPACVLDQFGLFFTMLSWNKTMCLCSALLDYFSHSKYYHQTKLFHPVPRFVFPLSLTIYQAAPTLIVIGGLGPILNRQRTKLINKTWPVKE